MSQELQIVQCYSCQAFQAQIVKKSNKWVCKVCDEKQSLRKVFGQGSGKDCRVHCQRLNALRANQNEQQNISLRSYKLEDNPTQLQGDKNIQSHYGNSKWNKYLSQPSGSDIEEEGEGGLSEIHCSQFSFSKCTPEYFEVPCAKKYKNDTEVNRTSNCNECLMGSEDDCFNVDIPDDYEGLKKNIDNGDNAGGERTTISISSKNENSVSDVCRSNCSLIQDDQFNSDIFSKKDDSVNNVPKSNFSLILDDLMEEETEEICTLKQCGLTQFIQGNINSLQISGNSNTKSLKNTDEMSPAYSKNNAVFKMVPSDNFVIEQLKKRISLLEDIDKYTIDELNEMCTF